MNNLTVPSYALNSLYPWNNNMWARWVGLYAMQRGCGTVRPQKIAGCEGINLEFR